MRQPPQRERHAAGVGVVHLLRWFDNSPACGVVWRWVTLTQRPVTYNACKRTRAWKDRKRVPGEKRA